MANQKRSIEFVAAEGPVREPVTKFGGQPVWLEKPEWPLSKETGNPMRFICQVSLEEARFPGATGKKMAYLFMTEEEDGEWVDGTYEADGGENALIVQPGRYQGPAVERATGPSLYAMVQKAGHRRLQREPREFVAVLGQGVDEADRPDEEPAPGEKKYTNQIGGDPVFLQGDARPTDGSWRLLLQLDSCNVPFYVNFGDAGVGYAFVDEAAERGKFLWQCA